MGVLRILRLEYVGDRYFFESPSLDQEICVIEGPNGSGKSTFFNLLYFGLGGKVAEFDDSSDEKHEEILGDTNNLVRLVVRLNGRLFTLTRKVRENLITVFEGSSSADGVAVDLNAFTLPIFRKDGDTRTFSDWILEELDIPVVEIFQGGRNFKLNFTDLARLIYHNQSPDPHGIFKPADSANFITDSLEIRRAIFQILVGKTLLALYDAIGRMKLAERDHQAARAIHQEYEGIVSQLLKASGVATVQNTKSLEAEIQEAEARLASLQELRDGLLRGQSADSTARAMLEADMRALQEAEHQRRSTDIQLAELSSEASRVVEIERALRDDIERVNKVIYTHGQLKLFSSDTCPYCLNAVSRAQGKCVCGSDVDEFNYQRYFYSSAEYLEILRSKAKALDTLLLAAQDLKEEKARLLDDRQKLEEAAEQIRDRLDQRPDTATLVTQALEEADSKLLEVRETLSKLQEAYRLESKLAGLQTQLDSKKRQFEAARTEVGRLDAASKAELQSQIAAFNEIYNDMMTSVLKDCRVAQIDSETYLPVINNGMYREASANVPKRFLYFLTLLQLSLLHDIPFPRLLLVDTPETAGIDLPHLVKMLRFIETLKNPSGKDHQVLLSTGVGKYPPEFESFVVLRLSDSAKLLNSRG